jgi:hypothetical protein
VSPLRLAAAPAALAQGAGPAPAAAGAVHIQRPPPAPAVPYFLCCHPGSVTVADIGLAISEMGDEMKEENRKAEAELRRYQDQLLQESKCDECEEQVGQ